RLPVRAPLGQPQQLAAQTLGPSLGVGGGGAGSRSAQQAHLPAAVRRVALRAERLAVRGSLLTAGPAQPVPRQGLARAPQDPLGVAPADRHRGRLAGPGPASPPRGEEEAGRFLFWFWAPILGLS